MTNCKKGTKIYCGFCSKRVVNSGCGGNGSLNVSRLVGELGGPSKSGGGEGSSVGLVSQFLTVLRRFDFDKSGGKLESRKEKVEEEEEKGAFGELKVCGDCSEVLEGVCSLYHEIMCLEMKLHWKLSEFKEGILTTTPSGGGGGGGSDKKNGSPSKSVKTDGRDDYPSFSSNPVEGFRERVFNKLSRIAATAPPRVVLEEEVEEKKEGGSQSVDDPILKNIPKIEEEDAVNGPMDILGPDLDNGDLGYEEVGDFNDGGSCSGDSMDVNVANDVELITIDDSDDDGHGAPAIFEILSIPGSPQTSIPAPAGSELIPENLLDATKEDPLPSTSSLTDTLPDFMSPPPKGPSNLPWRTYKSGLVIKVGKRMFLDKLSRRMLHKRRFLSENNDRMPEWSSQDPPPSPKTNQGPPPPQKRKIRRNSKSYNFRSREESPKKLETQLKLSSSAEPEIKKKKRGRPPKFLKQKEEEEEPSPRKQRKALPNRKYQE